MRLQNKMPRSRLEIIPSFKLIIVSRLIRMFDMQSEFSILSEQI